MIGIPIGRRHAPVDCRATSPAAPWRATSSLVTRALRLIVWVMLPLAGLTIVLRTEIVTLLFGYGRFDERGVELTADRPRLPLARPGVGIAHRDPRPGVLRRPGHADAGRSRRSSPWPSTSRSPSLLVGRLELAGIGLAIAVGSWAEAGFLLAMLSRRVGGFDVGEVVRSGVVALACAVVASLVAWAAMTAAQGAIGPEPARLVLLAELGGRDVAGGPRLPRAEPGVADPGGRHYRAAHVRRPPSSGEPVTVGAPTSGDPSIAWDAFVAGHPLATYLQTAAWARVKAANGWSSRLVEADPGGGGTGRCPDPAPPPARGPVDVRLRPARSARRAVDGTRAGRLGRGAPVRAGPRRAGRRRGPRPDRPGDRARRPARRRRAPPVRPSSGSAGDRRRRSSRASPGSSTWRRTRRPSGRTSARSGASTSTGRGASG